MKPEEDTPSLAKLSEDIQKFQDKTAPPVSSNQGMGAGLGMRLGIELVAGVLVGVGAGVLLDKWWGTSPLMLLVCFCFGTAGGALNMWRDAKALSDDEDKTLRR